MMTRRQWLAAAAASLVRVPAAEAGQGAGAPGTGGDPVVVRLGVNYASGQYFFDPAGVWVPPGGTVRWQFPFRGGVGALMGITVTAFHPSNGNHELRMPPRATPFDSGPMNTARDGFVRFEHTFTIEGTYDYFSAAHEVLGMVGRIVVGQPGGPAEQPPGYGGSEGRAVVYPAEAAILNACVPAEIVEKKAIPYPRDLVKRLYPFGQRQ